MVYVSAFIIALIVLFLFSPRYVRGASILPIFFFFLILFLSGVASRYWIAPYGPVILGVSWVPLLVIVLLVGLLLSAPSPYKRYSKKDEETGTEIAAVGLLAWIVLIILIVLIIAGIIRSNADPSILEAPIAGLVKYF